MKQRFVLFCLCLILLCTIGFVPHVQATSIDNTDDFILVSETCEQFSDGSKIITSVYEVPVLSRSNLYNKSGAKTRTFTDADGNVVWTFTVRGEFRILEGASVTCISATCSSELYETAWSCTRKSATPSGSWAIANGEFAKTILGIVVSRESVEVSLTSDVYGNLS